MRRRWTQVMVGAVALAVVGTGAAYAADSTPPAGPPQSNFVGALAYALTDAEASPPGANDFDCRPSAAHPRPVVLVHGTVESAYLNWAELSPQLKAEGYCVFALNYGGKFGAAGNPFKGTEDIVASAGELSRFVDRVLGATGAAKVDVVGHSQGGMMPRYYLKNLGGDAKVRSLIALAPSNYGTVFYGVLPLVAALPGGEEVASLGCRSCVQQRQGSDFLRELNRGGDTVPGVRYTVISTVYDQVVMPFTNTFLRDPGATNIVLQQRCPADGTDHLGISYDPNAQHLVRNALDPANATPLVCRPVPPLVG